MNTDT